MKKKTYAHPVTRRSLSIEQWRALAAQGDSIPVTITLAGDSMRPLIRRDRDRVTIIPLGRELMIGDIVLFRGGPERFVVHRVSKIRDGMVQTFGDNCLNPDAWMPLEDVWGLVIKMERGGRSIRLDTKAARSWGRCWMAAYPVRRVYLRLRSVAARAYRKVFKKT